jgi:hypothetical protein
MQLKQLFLLLIILVISPLAKASHIMGGEITWTCSGANSYVFQLVIYRDCNGNDILSNSLDLEVWGHPTISTIQVTKTAIIDLSPPCTQVPAGPIQLDCGVGTGGGNGGGAIQKIIFNSAPIILTGTPPIGGWSFTFDDWSRSWTLTNINTPANYGITLSATMYQVSGNVTNCVDSSPQFGQEPYMLLCGGTDFEFDSNVFDPDGDELEFSWGIPLNNFTGTFNPPINPFPVPFNTGFSATNPTPDASFMAGNAPAVMDPSTGVIDFTSNTLGEYAVMQKINSYRDGQLISTVNREFQLVIINCASATVNTAPQITAPFNGNTTYEAEFFAGDLIDFDIIINDNEVLQDGTPQTVTLSPSGDYFGTNLTDPNSGCDVLPCATLDLPPIISGVQGVNTHFNWQTDCEHLEDVNGVPQQEQVFNFVLKAQDDFCSVPGVTYKTITIKLKNSVELPPADLHCVNVLANGDVELTWTKSDPTVGAFTRYEIHSFDGTNDNTIATINDINTEFYLYTGAGADIASKSYYIETKFGCGGSSSVKSDTLKSIHLDLNIISLGRISLSWNLTHEPINNGDNQLQNIMREYPIGTWTLIEQVPYGTTFFIDTVDVCDSYQNYRIEIPNAAGGVSGSNIVGDQLQDEQPPYVPVITSVSVDTVTNGMVVSWDQNAALDTYGYIIWSVDNYGFWYVVDTVYGISNTSYQYFSADLDSEWFGVAAFDSCQSTVAPFHYHTSSVSVPQHKSIYLKNTLDICSKQVTLSWNHYEGFERENYEIIAKVGNSSYDVIATVGPDATTYSHTGLLEDEMYYYYIRVVSEDGIRAYSNLSERYVLKPTPPAFHYISTATHLLSDEIEIELYTDPNAAVKEYEIERKGPNELHFEFLSNLSTSASNTIYYNDSDIDSKVGAYNYRVNLTDSCGNIGEQTNTVKTIFLQVSTQDTEMKTTLFWSDYEGFDGSITNYRVYRGINGVFDQTPLAELSGSIRTYVDDVNAFYESEGQFCYRVEAIENLNSYGFVQTAFSNTVCVSIEPLAYIPNAFTVDGVNPIFKPIISLYDFESYDLQIFSRWGDLVFHTYDRDLGWDGRGNNGQLVKEGVYVYILRFSDESGKDFEFTNNVSLIHFGSGN